MQCRKIMESPWYQNYFPNTRIDQTKKSQTTITTTKGGYRLAKSINGSFTGWGADYIIIDDPIKAGGAMSKADRNHVNDQFDSAILSRLNDKKDGRIIIAMQRVHGDDLTGHVLRKGTWDHFSLPAIAQKDINFNTGQNSSHTFKKGQSLHPERDDVEVLEKLRKEMGNSAFQTQYLQDPPAAFGNYIKEEWFSKFRSSEPIYCDEKIQSWDTASKTGDGNSYSVCTTWGVKKDRFYLIDVHRGRYEFPELLKMAKALNKKWNPNYILVEDASSGIQLCQTLLRTTDLPVKIRKTKLDKETRLQEASFFIEQRMVWLPDNIKWLQEFLDEVLSFPDSKYDDQVDSMVQFLLFMRDQMPIGEGSVVTPIHSAINSPNLDLRELY